jgi:hypothetical protein
MVLRNGSEPEYINWEDGPKYIYVKLSELIAAPEKYLLPKSYVKCETDIDINYIEANEVRDADAAYVGGHVHEVSAEEAASLIDAGYEDYITEI